ncbi:odorant receptor 67b-like [Mycetomoellerius zeteki]|uniref:odorant receptor 67b-like n=1 Tax=Mycetomoellerius zeteki TaxID=64791 RepID=UPI00084E3A5E|nr:PREDICTED: odorant receptor 67b-like [Trachymyrmex zeteki]
MAMDWKKNSSADFSARVRTNKAILSQNFAKTVFGIFSIAITLYTASVFTFDTSNLEETDISMRPLILKMDFPFNNNNTRFVYGLVLVTQFFCTVLCGCTVVMLNVLLVVLVLHLAGQIEILGKWFTNIISEENGHRLNLAMMRKIIEKHQNNCREKQEIMRNNRTINRTVEFMLTMFGVWPGISCVILYRVFWMITLAINQFFHYSYFVTHFHFDNLFDLMDCLSSFLAHVKLTVKLIIFSLKQRKFVEILTTMAEDWNDCNNDGVAVRETAGKTKLSSRICNGLIILHTIAAFAYVIGILLADADVTDRTAELPLMMKMEYPFIIDTQRKYSLVLVTQFLFVMVCSWGAGLFNALFLTLTLHVGSQINILLCWLTKIGSKDIENKHDSFVTVTTKIIRKHQKIINLSENVENLYSYIALLQFTSNIVMICSLAFLIVTAIGSPDATEQIVRSLLFYAVTNLEAFIFCFAGEYLSNKSKAIGNAAYNSAWYDMKAKDSRVLLFIILRSQRQLKLTAGKMTVLSFECFTNIMKASGSYLSVLLAMK